MYQTAASNMKGQQRETVHQEGSHWWVSKTRDPSRRGVHFQGTNKFECPLLWVQYNLKECIDSVVEQTYSDWELIICDDGSTDLTADICRNYVDADSRIKYIRQENSGVSAARNNVYIVKRKSLKLSSKFPVFGKGIPCFCQDTISSF